MQKFCNQNLALSVVRAAEAYPTRENGYALRI